MKKLWYLFLFAALVAELSYVLNALREVIHG